jgi:hypothetical protein
MNKSDHSLDRLLNAAKAATAAGQYRSGAPEELPFGFTTRVLAGWRVVAGPERPGLDALWFRRAFLGAVAVMAIAVSWSYKTDTAAPNEEMAIASYDAGADLP